MKKLIALLLALVLVMGLAACGNTTAPETTPATTEATEDTEPTETTEETVPAPTPNEATDTLATIWDAYEGVEFFAMGGDMNSMVDGAPGNYDLADEGLTATLYVPADQVSNLVCASSLMHGMLANNFTCGMYLVKDDADVKAFADAMKEAVGSAQWICGTPEKMIIATVDTQFVMVAFGLNDVITALETALTTVHPGAEILYNEPIVG